MFKQRKIIFSDQPNEPSGGIQSFFSSLMGSKEAKESEPEGAGTVVAEPQDPAKSNLIVLDNNSAAQPANNQDPDASIKPVTPESQELQDLKAQVAQLTQLISMQQNQVQQPVEPTKPSGPTDPFESDAFRNLSTVMSWDETEQAAMKTFLKQVSDYTNHTSVAAAQKSIPEIVNSSLSTQEKQRAIREKFYSDNKQLEQFKPLVSEIARNVSQEFQFLGRQATPEMILQEAANRAYQTLGLTKQNNKVPANQNQPGSGSGQTPAFAAGSGGASRKPPVQLSETQQMIGAIADLT